MLTVMVPMHLTLQAALSRPHSTGFYVIVVNSQDQTRAPALFSWDDLLDAATHRDQAHVDMLDTADALEQVVTRIREHVAHENRHKRDE